MKASLVIFLAVMEQLKKHGQLLPRPIWALFTSDEEIGSPTSRSSIESWRSSLPMPWCSSRRWPTAGSRPRGRASADSISTSQGKAAHAGVAPQQGRNAIVELAHQILKLEDLQDLAAGTTINVGVIRGGTTTNVVPAHASAEIDVRVATRAEEARIESALAEHSPRQPRESSDAARILQPAADGANRGQRVPLRESPRSSPGPSIGGSSSPRDLPAAAATATSPSALGIPTLDGLGPRGAGAHADDEHILLDSLPERAALIHALAHGFVGQIMTDTTLATKVGDAITIRRADRSPTIAPARRLKRVPGASAKTAI